MSASGTLLGTAFAVALTDNATRTCVAGTGCFRWEVGPSLAALLILHRPLSCLRLGMT